VECEVCELVPQHLHGIAGARTGVGALHDDAALVGNRNRGAPLRSAGSGPLAESAMIGRDRNEHAFRWARQTGKRVGCGCAREHGVREGEILRKGDDGESALVQSNGRRSDLRGRRRCVRRRETCEGGDERYALRAGVPPSSMCLSISPQRLPHGLNLLAASPARHVSSASSRLLSNQRTRPSS